MEVEAAPPLPRPSRVRLILWTAFVGLIALFNYAARLSGGSGSSSKGVSHQEIYSYATFAGGMVIYAIWLGIVLLICRDRFDLLALRSPRRWGRALGLGVLVIVAIFVWEGVISYLPLPESPVMTTRRSRGSVRSMFLRLCCRAPRISILSRGMKAL